MLKCSLKCAGDYQDGQSGGSGEGDKAPCLSAAGSDVGKIRRLVLASSYCRRRISHSASRTKGSRGESLKGDPSLQNNSFVFEDHQEAEQSLKRRVCILLEMVNLQSVSKRP